jgi:hypothetical protein
LVDLHASLASFLALCDEICQIIIQPQKHNTNPEMMQFDIPTREGLEIMETALGVLLKEDLAGLRSKILRMSSEEFELCVRSIGKFSQNISLSTYKKYMPYSLEEKVDVNKWKEKNLFRKSLRHVLYFPGEDVGTFSPEA